MNKEIEIKNFLSTEEAKKLWNSKVRSFPQDMIAFYIPSEEEEADQLIGIIDSDVVKNEMMPYNTYELIAVGDKCSLCKEGDVVILDPAMVNSARPIILNNNVFTVVTERAVLTILK